MMPKLEFTDAQALLCYSILLLLQGAFALWENPLNQLAKMGNMTGVEELIGSNPLLICQPDCTGSMPATLAISHDHLHILRKFLWRLLEVPFSSSDIFHVVALHRITDHAKTVIHFLGSKGNQGVAEKTISELGGYARNLKEAPYAVEEMLTAQDRSGSTPCHAAAAHGYRRNLAAFFALAANASDDQTYNQDLLRRLMTQCNTEGCNLLMAAASGYVEGNERHDPLAGSKEVINFLLEQVSSAVNITGPLNLGMLRIAAI